MKSTYSDFLSGKVQEIISHGVEGDLHLNLAMFPHQIDVTSWALRLGRAALFLDTGLGKTICELEWARVVALETQKPALILAPLAVSSQTVLEGARFGVPVKLCKSQDDVVQGVNITNYERLHHFDLSSFGGVALDESSILKSQDGKTRTALIQGCQRVPYRLAATATPAPNDHVELGNHAEFLGICTREEMLAEYFVHDGGETSVWRLKGHAKRDFWRWVSSWAVALQSPADLGYDASRYALAPLETTHHRVSMDTGVVDGALFAIEARTLTEQRIAKRASLESRVQLTADLINNSDEAWVIWCELNDESAALTRAIPDALEITGSDSPEAKEAGMLRFTRGEVRVLISKPSICGFGMNWQHCHNTAFVGVGNSFEMYYQAIRRFWRFGQQHTVNVHLVYSEAEEAVLRNLMRKQGGASEMTRQMVDLMREFNALGLKAEKRSRTAYAPARELRVPSWLVTEAA